MTTTLHIEVVAEEEEEAVTFVATVWLGWAGLMIGDGKRDPGNWLSKKCPFLTSPYSRATS